MKAYFLDIARQITGSFGRFFSILIISALGVGSFAGLRSVSPDMRLTADMYYDEAALMDIRVMSTLGFSQNDIDALHETGYTVQPTYTLDAMIKAGESSEYTVKLYAHDPSYEINKPELMQGRLPEGAREIALGEELMRLLDISQGDTVRLSSGKKEPITDFLFEDTYTVVGSVRLPMYISDEYGGSPLGNGSLNGYAVLACEAFDMEVYTAVFMTVPGAASAQGGTQEYADIIDGALDSLGIIASVREPGRYDEIFSEADEKLTDAERELADGEREREEKLADARAKMDDAKIKIEDAEKELEDGRAELERELARGRRELRDAEGKIAEGETEIEENRQKLLDAQKEVDNGRATLDSEKKKLKDAAAQLDEGQISLDKGREELTNGEAQLAGSRVQLDGLAGQIAQMQAAPAGSIDPADIATAQAIYDEGMRQYQEGMARINAGWDSYYDGAKSFSDARDAYHKGVKEVEKAENELIAAQKDIDDGWVEINKAQDDLMQARIDVWQGYDDLNKAEREGLSKIEEGEAKLADARAELAEGEEEYAREEESSAKKIADAKEELRDAREKLDELEMPEWYFFTRDDNPSYTEYYDNTDRIAAIATVFPLVFFGVAILISLTTMSRMVEEQRGFIGTMKLLGYSRFAIAFKYLVYAFFPCGIGVAVGVLLLGRFFFPWIVASAYNIMYHMPPVVMPLQPVPSLIAATSAMSGILLAAFISVRMELKHMPAHLLRPKAPKPGKRIFLEMIPIIWNHVSFSWKVTLRNIFRYKARFLMTLVGVAGCTSLIVTGFGIKDSLDAVPRMQYGDIWKYDVLVACDIDKLKIGEYGLEKLLEEHGADELSWWRQESMVTTGKRYDCYLTVVNDPASFGEIVTLRTYDSHEPLSLDEDGAVITYKLSRLLGLDVGDTIRLTDAEELPREFIITGITENYIEHYVFIVSSLYARTFGVQPEHNLLAARLEDDTRQARDTLGNLLMDTDGVLTRIFTADTFERVGNMFEQLNVVVAVLIVAAAALALVVLYNLNNINISERVRELATIKVLGFTGVESAAYVLRESMLMTLMGILAGFVGGKLLHAFVMGTVEVDMVMFGRSVYPESFLYAGLLTVLFAAIVSLAMLPKLRSINMVESLKSVE